eukprot:8142389-Pyramimonas_sp.AAC.1
MYDKYSVEYSICCALNGIQLNGVLVSTADDCRLLNRSRRHFRPSTPGLDTSPSGPPTPPLSGSEASLASTLDRYLPYTSLTRSLGL